MSVKRPKITVEIVDKTGVSHRRKLEIDETGDLPAVIINKGGAGRGDVRETAEFDKSCIIFEVKRAFPFFWIKQLKNRLVMEAGAKRCKSFSSDESSFDEKASCTKEDVKRYANAQVLRNAGRGDKPENRTFLYILMFANIAVSVICLLVLSGHLRL